MKCIDVKIIKEGKDYLIFTFDNGFEYDPSLSDTECDWWISHMRGKQWFTKEVEEKTMNLLSK